MIHFDLSSFELYPLLLSPDTEDETVSKELEVETETEEVTDALYLLSLLCPSDSGSLSLQES